MRPISVEIEATLPISPTEVSENLLDLERWADFEGYGLIPGVKRARFVHRTQGLIGSLIEVENEDGSRITQRIDAWDPEREIRFVADDLQLPMSHVAERFEERWSLSASSDGTHVRRWVGLTPKSTGGRILLRAFAPLLRQALRRHMHNLAARAEAHTSDRMTT